MAQPSKGVRIQMTTRIPVDLHRRVAVEAARRGRNFNDMICVALAEALGDSPTPGAKANVTIYDDDGNPVGVV